MTNEFKIDADHMIRVSGWLFILQAILISVTLILKLTVIPIDALASDNLSAYEPLLAVGLFFIGRGILKKKEWIRGFALWVLWLRLIVGAPVVWITKGYSPIWIFLIDILINAYLIFSLTRPYVKKCFVENLANQKFELTVKTPGD